MWFLVYIIFKRVWMLAFLDQIGFDSLVSTKLTMANDKIDITKLGNEYGNVKLVDEIQKAWIEKNVK